MNPHPVEALLRPPVELWSALHAVEPDQQDVWMDLSERVGHTLVLGTTRVGKTRLAEILITQDIRRGDVVIVFDPKGDADLLRRVYAEAKRAGRAKDFYLFHLGFPEVSARYNAIGSFSRITEVATRIANQLPSEGNLGRVQRVRLALRQHHRPVAEYVLAAIQVTQVFSIRLAVLALAMPVFVMFSLVAIVDGLVKRDLRRWGGGRESSFVYHWAKRSALPLLVFTWVIYLALPFSLHPSFVVLPFATLFALSVAVTASTFKKYL